MRHFTLKRHLLVAITMLLCGISAHAADLITQQITVNVEKAGTLPDKIGDTRLPLITNLKLTGELNSTDIRHLRQYGKEITTLDLEEAKIVEGGRSYYYSYGYTKNNTIGDYMFKEQEKLTSIKLPSNVTSIGNSAFYGCTSLTSITIPSSVTEILSGAFYGCTSLTSINIPSSVTRILSGAFSSCTSLTSVTIPSSVTKIESSTFSSCTSLTSVTIPSSVTEIESSTFYGCTSLTSVTIPSSVTSIESYAFYGCTSLTSVTIPSSVTYIENGAFRGCTSLTSVTIPSSVTKIESSTFYGCTSLTSVTIPSSVTSIESYAFYGCTSLTSVTIPSSVTSIGGDAFSACTSLYLQHTTPPSFSSRFDKDKVTVYIPQGTYNDYWLTNWGNFKLVEYNATGIENIKSPENAEELSRFSINGQHLDAPQKGINIIKMSDGSVKKVVVK